MDDRPMHQAADAKSLAPYRPLLWIVCGLMTAAMVVIVVPGGKPSRWSDRPVKGMNLTHVFHYQHGWPLVFLERADGYGPDRPNQEFHKPLLSYLNGLTKGVGISWSAPGAWFAGSVRNEWNLAALFIDATLAIVLIAAATFAARLWLRQRQHWRQLRLTDWFLLTAALAVGFGWYQGHAKQDQLRAQAAALEYAIAQQETPNGIPLAAFLCVNNTDSTPRWINRLLGTSAFTPWCTHSNRGRIVVNDGDEDYENHRRLVERMAYLNLVSVSGPPTQASLERLPKMASRETLETVRLNPANRQASLGQSLNDESLPTPVGSVDLLPLLSLPNLKSIVIAHPGIRGEHIKPLLASPMLKTLHLQQARVTEDELAELSAAGPSVEIIPPIKFVDE